MNSQLLAISLLAAVPDGWVIGFGIVQVCANAIMALVILSLNNRQRRLELLEQHIAERNDQLVDSKFTVMSGRLQGSIDALTDRLQGMQARLHDGEDEIRDMLAGSHSLEMRIAAQISQVKDFVRENAASKSDVEKLDSRVERLSMQIAQKRGAQ